MTPEVEERAHALFSPSSAYTWISCAASIAAQVGQPDESSEYADDGTASHELAKWCLDSGNDAAAYIGRVIPVGEREFEVDDERAEYVQLYLDDIRNRIAAYELTGATVTMLVEQRLSIEHITGEIGGKGTSDCILIAVWPDGRAELCVIDLKYGRGVEVVAEWNYQGLMYAAAAYFEHSDFVEFTSVRIVIHQVRLNPKPSEWELSPAELLGWEHTIATPAAERAAVLLYEPETIQITDYAPGEKQCKFCKAKATCPALAAHVEATLDADFEKLAFAVDIGIEEEVQTIGVARIGNERLGLIYASLDLIDGWMKAVRGRIEHELFAGHAVPGVKLVAGRRGARKWSDHESAETTLKSMRFKQEQMYNFKLISPTQAEKLVAKESPRRWKKLEQLITQSQGSPSVAPDTDSRPALEISPPEDDFEVVAEPAVDTAEDLC